MSKDVTRLKPYERPVNTVFQSYALFPHMTVLENVAFGLRRRKIADPVGKAHEALQLVELDHLAGRKPQQLSGGQQQRVALARAIVNRPALLLLDEPLGALDLKLRRQMQLELKSIQNEVGLTFLHVTHDQEEAMTMADTVAVMNEGRIEQLGAPEELYELPRTVFVANFLGQSNLFSGKVAATTATTIELHIGGTRIVVDKSRSQRHTGEVTVGVRPEKVRLLTAPPPEAADLNVLGPGRVIDVSFSGVSTQYLVAIAGIGTIVVFAQNVDAAPVIGPDTQVWVSWRVEHGFGLEDTAPARHEAPTRRRHGNHRRAETTRHDVGARGVLTWLSLRSRPGTASPSRRPGVKSRIALLLLPAGHPLPDAVLPGAPGLAGVDLAPGPVRIR